MEVYVVRKRRELETVWEVQHRGATDHNHPPSSYPASHPVIRRASRTDSVRLAIKTDSETDTSAIARLLV
jgi:hypothetical protein